jgi:ABC-type oligopeptide transport system substrate-binding subunit
MMTKLNQRSFILSATAMACLLLSACTTAPVQQASGTANKVSKVDMDQLLQVQPSGTGIQAANLSDGHVLKGLTRQDPKSGLRVEMGPQDVNPEATAAVNHDVKPMARAQNEAAPCSR